MKIRLVLAVVAMAAVSVVAYTRREAQAQEAKPLRIMCIGASITMGAGVNGGYRLPLEKMLEGAGIPVEFVGRANSNSKGMTSPFHDGYSGFRIDQVVNGEKNVCPPLAEGVKALQPNVALILCGTNDVRQNRDLPHAPERMDGMIGLIREAAPDVKVLVASLPPDLHNDDGTRRYNAGVAEVVAKRAAAGQKVEFVNFYDQFSPAVDLSGDRIHPTQPGYLKIARAWFKALAPNAGQVGYAVTTEGAVQRPSISCSGYKITMKADATITDLGINSGGKALAAPHAIGVFDGQGKVLVQTEIKPSSTQVGLFAWEKLAQPLTLKKGQSYVILSNNQGLNIITETAAVIDPMFYENPRFYFDFNLGTLVGTPATDVLKFPGAKIQDFNGAVGFFGPNFRLAPQ